jgi:DNA-binding CsgD family transcriptional regulator
MVARVDRIDWPRLACTAIELSEMAAAGDVEATSERLLGQVCELLDVDNALLGLAVHDREGECGIAGWTPRVNHRYGADAARYTEIIGHWFRSRHNFERDPGTDLLARTAGAPRAFLRTQAIDDRSWKRSPMFELYEALGTSDRVTGACPAGPGVELTITAYAHGGHLFRDRDRDVLASFLGLVQPAARRLALAHGLGGATRPLTPRERETLRYLLEGLAERDVARASGLTWRSTHQVVAGIYRKFGVSSRAELMARFLRGS